jgi:hypothetical protein
MAVAGVYSTTLVIRRVEVYDVMPWHTLECLHGRERRLFCLPAMRKGRAVLEATCNNHGYVGCSV